MKNRYNGVLRLDAKRLRGVFERNYWKWARGRTRVIAACRCWYTARPTTVRPEKK